MSETPTGADVSRRGLPWEEWEDRLLLDVSLSSEAIAAKCRRTPHSVSERRRWVLRIGDIVRSMGR